MYICPVNRSWIRRKGALLIDRTCDCDIFSLVWILDSWAIITIGNYSVSMFASCFGSPFKIYSIEFLMCQIIFQHLLCNFQHVLPVADRWSWLESDPFPLRLLHLRRITNIIIIILLISRNDQYNFKFRFFYMRLASIQVGLSAKKTAKNTNRRSCFVSFSRLSFG